MRLANQNLLQYSDLDELQLFKLYLDIRIFMIFGKSGSFEKKDQIHVKNRHISGVQLKMKIFPMQLASKNLNIAQIFNQYLYKNILMIFGKSRSFEETIKYILNTLISYVQ